jgi:hypothetical protein
MEFWNDFKIGSNTTSESKVDNFFLNLKKKLENLSLEGFMYMYEFLCRNNLKLESQLILNALNFNKYLDN